MYRAFFGLREQPFNLTPDPKFLYLNTGYREALAAMRYGISGRKGFVSLVGEAGTGKTTLLRCLLAELGPEVRSVLVLNPAIGFEELLSFILTDLGRPAAPDTPKLELLQALNAELLDTLARGGNVVVLLDEAQDLAIPVLEELRLLSNLETAKEKILQIVLAGQPELDAMLARPELRQLRQRIAVPARLRPLARREVAAYVAARIAAAGGDGRGLFTPAALYRLWRFSRGVPRLLNLACDNALITAYAAGSRRVGWKTVGEAARDLHRPQLPAPGARPLPRFRLGTIGLAVGVGAVIGIGASQLVGSGAPGRPPTLVPVEPIAAAGVSLHPPGGARAADAAPAAVARTASGAAASAPTSRWGAMAPSAEDAESARAVPPVASSTASPDGALVAAAPARPVAGIAGDAAAPLASEGIAPAVVAPPGPGDVVVRVAEGDYLVRIARRRYGSDARPLLEAIQRANPGLVDLNILLPGQTIVLPGSLVSHEAAAAVPVGEAASGTGRAGE